MTLSDPTNPVLDFADAVDAGTSGWGDSRRALSTTVGDLNGDGDEELVVGRNAGENMRIAVFDFVDGAITRTEIGNDWGESISARAVGVADWDGDGVGELIAGRSEGDHWRFATHEDLNHGLARVQEHHRGWGESYYVTDIAAGDHGCEIEGDGREVPATVEHTTEELGVIGSTLLLDVFAPPPVDPYWSGDVSMYLAYADANLSNQWVHTAPLGGEGLHTLAFDLDSAYVQVLNEDRECRILIALNAGEDAGTFVIDHPAIRQLNPSVR